MHLQVITLSHIYTGGPRSKWYHFRIKWYDIENLSDINFDNTLKLSDIFLVSDITFGLDYIITLESSDITLEL